MKTTSVDPLASWLISLWFLHKEKGMMINITTSRILKSQKPVSVQAYGEYLEWDFACRWSSGLQLYGKEMYSFVYGHKL